MNQQRMSQTSPIDTSPTKRQGGTLIGWFHLPNGSIAGWAMGDDTWQEGSSVQTSTVQGYGGSAEGMYCTTRNTKYMLLESDPSTANIALWEYHFKYGRGYPLRESMFNYIKEKLGV